MTPDASWTPYDHRKATPSRHTGGVTNDRHYLDGPRPRAFAHRGWHIGDLAGMENSMSSFRRAVSEGFHYLETDVHATSDGVVVVHHDRTLDRTTDAYGAVVSQTWRHVRRARIGGVEPISRLEDVLEELPDALFNIDIKADSAVEPVLAVLHKVNAWSRVCLASFSDTRLARMRRLAGPRLLTAMGPRAVATLWLFGRLSPLPASGTMHGHMVQIPVRHGLLTLVDRRMLRQAHRRGLEMHVWTVNDEAEMRRLLGLGVDGLITDRPDMLREVLRARDTWSERV